MQQIRHVHTPGQGPAPHKLFIGGSVAFPSFRVQGIEVLSQADPVRRVTAYSVAVSLQGSRWLPMMEDICARLLAACGVAQLAQMCMGITWQLPERVCMLACVMACRCAMSNPS